jgi:hypothetical protein
MPWGRVLATTVSMLLYLCSEDPDVRRVPLPPGPGAPRAAANSTRALTSRLAYRRSPQGRPSYHSATRGEETGRHVAPHLHQTTVW